jgi:hypothetical protein
VNRPPVRAYENASVADRADAVLGASLLPLGTLVLARVFGVSWGVSFGMAGVVAIGVALDATNEETRR